MKRALTLQNVIDANVGRFDFEGEWFEAFGRPQKTGIWFICGNSGAGKTSFILKLLKLLAQDDKVLFESYEEGEVSAALQDGIERFGLLEVKKNVQVAVDTKEDFEERLTKRKSPRIVFIDSVELCEYRNIKEISELARKHPEKLFVFIGQAEGKDPKSKLGKSIRYLANQKFWVEGYRALNLGRSQGEIGFLTIWEEGARKYWDFR